MVHIIRDRDRERERDDPYHHHHSDRINHIKSCNIIVASSLGPAQLFNVARRNIEKLGGAWG